MNEKLIITGASENIEWLLPWWYSKFLKWNKENIPLVVFDFGLSGKAHTWAKKNGITLQKPVQKCEGWFYKPTALREAKGKLKLWVDVDCEFKGGFSELFDFIQEDKLLVSHDRFHSWGCIYQTGVVGVKDDPKVLQLWEKKCIKPEGQYGRGDQELLWELISKTTKDYIAPYMPEKFNWLRMEFWNEKTPGSGKHPDLRITHWTGEVGKKVIANAIKNKTSTINAAGNMIRSIY